MEFRGRDDAEFGGGLSVVFVEEFVGYVEGTTEEEVRGEVSEFANVDVAAGLLAGDC